MARDAAVWFVMIGGVQSGPMSRAEVSAEVDSGAVTADSYVFKHGMGDWKPAGEVPDLVDFFSAAPPPPPPPPPQARSARLKTAAAPAKNKFRVTPEDAARDTKAKGMAEFNTAHFKLSDLPKAGETKDWSKLTVQHDIRQFKEGVEGYADAIPQRPDVLKAPEPGKDWSKLTVQHDIRQFKEGVEGYADAMSATPAAVVAGSKSGRPAARTAPAPTRAASGAPHQHEAAAQNGAAMRTPAAGRIAPTPAAGRMPSQPRAAQPQRTPISGSVSAATQARIAQAREEARKSRARHALTWVGGAALLAVLVLMLMMM